MRNPTDEEIIAAVRDGATETYVIKNRLNRNGKKVTTTWVRRALRRLEAEGHVKKVPTWRKQMLAWEAIAPSQTDRAEGGGMSDPLPYIYRWDRQGRKAQPCNVLIRTKVMNSCLVEFADGYRMVTSRNAIKRNPAASSREKKEQGA